MITWKRIIGWPYEISYMGDVRHIVTRRIRVHGVMKNGYHNVCLSNGPVRKTLLIHRLVLATFIGPCPDGYEVNHKNAIKSDNALANLEYVTPKQNSRHAVALGLLSKKKNKGEANIKAKLSNDNVLEIRQLAASGIGGMALSKRFGVGFSTIRRVITRRQWNHI